MCIFEFVSPHNLCISSWPYKDNSNFYISLSLKPAAKNTWNIGWLEVPILVSKWSKWSFSLGAMLNFKEWPTKTWQSPTITLLCGHCYPAKDREVVFLAESSSFLVTGNQEQFWRAEKEISKYILGGGNSNILLFSPLFIWGRWTHFDGHIFSEWVGSTTNQKISFDPIIFL